MRKLHTAGARSADLNQVEIADLSAEFHLHYFLQIFLLMVLSAQFGRNSNNAKQHENEYHSLCLVLTTRISWQEEHLWACDRLFTKLLSFFVKFSSCLA